MSRVLVAWCYLLAPFAGAGMVAGVVVYGREWVRRWHRGYR